MFSPSNRRNTRLSEYFIVSGLSARPVSLGLSVKVVRVGRVFYDDVSISSLQLLLDPCTLAPSAPHVDVGSAALVDGLVTASQKTDSGN